MTAAEPEQDLDLGERLSLGEQEVALQIAAAMRSHIAQQYPAGDVKRDAHPKAHGCVRAEFHVNEDIPAQLARGVFIPGKRYKAWVRFSSGDGNPLRADSRGDSHGLAIKLLGVPGQKLLPAEQDAQTQDFLLIDHPVFVIDDPRHYLTLIERSNSTSLLKKLLAPFAMGLRGALIAQAISSTKIASLLDARYWSATAYRLGSGKDRVAVKFSARPRAAPTATLPDAPGPNFLRETLVTELATRDAYFDFLLQPRTSASMSVERSTVEWKESDSTFQKVATLKILKQSFSTPERDKFGENLSFTPWHALPEHRPLGGVNRVRRVVYEEISRFRHEQNRAPRTEPGEDSW